MITINTVAVVGAGTMGTGIAQVCAQAGLQVQLFDPQPAQLERSREAMQQNLQGVIARGKATEADAETALRRVAHVDSLDAIAADLIIEAIIEDLDAKQALFQALGKRLPQAILATNTSSIPITRIAGGVPNPGRVVGLHFFVPAHVMRLVEIIKGVQTSDATAEAVTALAKRLGKTPVKAADAPGFIVNRVARPYYVEALLMAEQGLFPLEDIDACLENFGFKMGPFRLMDLIGVDSNLNVTKSMFALFQDEGRFRPSRLQQQKVDAGLWGRKSGKGFYDYTAQKPADKL